MTGSAMSLRTTRFALLVLAATLLALPLAAGDLAGTWNFTWDTEGGVRKSTMEIQQDGKKLSAKLDATELSGEGDADGFVLSGKLYAPEAGYSGVLKIEGRLEGEKLTGKGAWDAHGLSFTAVRAE